MDPGLNNARTLQPGDVIAGRFELERMAGSGGMGAVWRARDRDRGEVVALKVTLGGSDGEDTRWAEREARLLARIDHPAVPRHVAHGETPDGLRYTVMEWLDGEVLSARLRRGPLDVDDSLALAAGVAEALAAVHARGVVHCDLTPSNVFLVGGDVARVKLLDFGLARAAGEAQEGAPGPAGTPLYMAPEQARGDQDVDARADLYALGCVLFQCLTGRPPFAATSRVATLTKALFERAPTPSALCPATPPAVDALVAALLAKDAWMRPSDAATVAQEIGALRAGGRGGTPERTSSMSLTGNERRLVSVVLAAARAGGRGPGDPQTAHRPALLGELWQLAQRHAVQLGVLRDGSVAAVLARAASPMELSAAAAGCALALRALLPEAELSLVTGWDVLTGTQSLGQVIDRAAALLDARPPGAPPGGVLLDPLTAALLGDRFVLSGDEEAPALLGDREPVEEVRRLLGRPTACVGRDRELGVLSAAFDECASLPAACAVLVTGGPGVGKSRLRDELVQRIRARGAAEIWIARGDPMRQRAPFGLLAQILRRAARLLDGEPIELRRHKLAALVARRVDRAEERRVAEFLGEMVGTPFPEEESVQLRAARQEPMLMGDQMRRAWVDFLEAECRAGPVLLVLEDLQWGDQPTVDYVDTALRLLGDRPLMVLATARPEVGEAFPALWAERGTTELRIGQLPRRACEALVREALGDAVSDEQVARLIERSARNAFFLEEIVRAFAEGRGEDVPETVLAMMQSRLESLEPEARRILRAGSLFGESFWRGAVKSLLGLAARAPDFDERLAELERREWITRRFDSKFRGEAEYTFRHGLIREAAYGMLTDEDRALGHRVAAEWLEQAGEMDAMALADHFDRGGEPAKAARWYRAGAQQALEGNDLGAAIQRVERAIACGASGPSLGELCLIRAEAHRWQGSFAEAESWADRAVAAFPEGSPSWFAALREVLASVVAAHARDRVVSIAGTLEASWSGPDAASSAQVAAMTWVSTKLLEVGLSERADAFLRKLDAVEGRFYADPAVYAHITMARAFREGFRADDMSALGRALQTSLHLFEAAGNLRSACLMKVNLTHVYNEVGAYRDNLELLDEIVAASRRLGLVYVETFAKSNLGRALGCLGRLAEAEAAEVEAIVAFGVQREERMEGISRAYLAVIAQQAGDLARAEAEARRAVEMLVQAPTLQPFALAVLASALLAGGRVAEALETARRAAGITDPVEEGEIMIRLVHAEALDASGEHAAAREALAAARDRVIARADKLTDPAWQRSFLEDVPENARTLALAHAWLSAGAGGEPPARQATLVPPGRGD